MNAIKPTENTSQVSDRHFSIWYGKQNVIALLSNVNAYIRYKNKIYCVHAWAKYQPKIPVLMEKFLNSVFVVKHAYWCFVTGKIVKRKTRK